MKKILIVAMTLLSSHVVLAGDPFLSLNASHALKAENMNVMQRAGDPDADSSCTNAYKKINKNHRHRIVLGVGYMDGTPSPMVNDPLVIRGLVSKLTAACNKDVETLCGFKSLPMNGAVLLRKLVRDTHDYSQKSVELMIVGGALSTNNTLNTGVNKAAEMQSCQAHEDLYHAEIKKGADTVLYFGHSRDGGGPDFCPPVTTENGQHVNYSYYKARREGIKGLAEALSVASKAGNSPSLIGMFSCSSQLHFKNRLSAVSPKSGLLLSTATVDFNYIYRSLLTTMSGLVNQTCREPIQWSLNIDQSWNRYKLLQFFNYME